MLPVTSSRYVMRQRRMMALLYGGLWLLGCQPSVQADMMPSEDTSAGTEISEMLASAGQHAAFIVPSAAQLAQATDLFEQMLKGSPPASLRTAWQQLGFGLTTQTIGHETWWVLQDQRQQGGGFYVFRHDADPWPVALQAPHSFHDLRTRELALLLMQEGRFAAAAWNTVHRYSMRDHAQQGGEDADRADANAADMAHTDASYFQAFTRAFARRYPHGAILQLHGFSQQKRKTEAGRSADMVLSNGSRSVSSSLLQLNRCFQQQFIGVSRLFPMEIDELGATTNRNASMLRAMGFTGFVHVEMSAPLRKKLVEIKFLRERMLSCVREVWG